MKLWNGMAVPDREAEHVLQRRVAQCVAAEAGVKALGCQYRVMVQAGGNWGYWPYQFSQIFGTVYTFEPDHECFVCLAHNTSKRKNVVRIQAALGFQRKLIDLWRDTDTSGNQKIAGEGIYPTLCIDDLALPICDLIYLDIEGREYEALLGAHETLRRCKPIVIFESRSAFKEEAESARIYLQAFGYELDDAATIGKDRVMRPRAE